VNLAITSSETQALVEGLGNLSGPAVVVFVLAMLLRGTLMLERHHRDVVEQFSALHQAEKTQLEARIADLEDDRNWWKDASVTSLRIGETLAVDGEGQ